ncbi:DUF3990 domain-containing protein [Flavobacterium columnare]|uniref:DUF3990 domain-containing protein n=3 Tax=Flavobacterium columnare TaxID=996 RepID=UPI0021D1E5EC|nr:DUF3990 domain-containing protein [Flavobacterium columnare]
MYGGLRNFSSPINLTPDFIPFRQLGQYEDPELEGLYYNRFRYYDCTIGNYISQDPIGLAGNNPTFYGYVKDSNSWIDIFGLDITTFYHAGSLSGPIDPSKGRTNLDFNPSGQGGFYVTTDKAQAQQWAEMRGHPEITQFDVPNSELEKLNIKKFDGASDEWAKFVTDGRAGKLEHNFDAVSGPMLANPRGKNPKPIGSQFAIFTDKAAKLFDNFKVKCS